jgi:alpha-tubulin suppressor-like RCC1 family protein
MIKKLRLILIILLTVSLISLPNAHAAAAPRFARTTAGCGDLSFIIKNDSSLWLLYYGGQEFKITDNVVDISANFMGALIIKSDGSLWEWTNSAADTFEELFVKIMDDVVSASAGLSHSVAVKSDGSLWAWGVNRRGALGLGYSDYNTVYYGSDPVKIMDNVSYASAGDDYTMVIKTDGSLWGWGNNRSGQLGIGNDREEPYCPSDHYTPVKIMDDVVFVSASVSGDTDHTMAIKKDGSLWVWGVNFWGNIGDGTTKNNYTPVKIMDGMPASRCQRSLYIRRNKTGERTFKRLSGDRRASPGYYFQSV